MGKIKDVNQEIENKPLEKNYKNSLYNYYDQDIKIQEFDKYMDMMEKGEELPENIRALEEEPILYDPKEELYDPNSSLIIEKENVLVNRKELGRLRKIYPDLEYVRTFSDDDEFRIKTKIKVVRQFKFVKRTFITDEEYEDIVIQEKYSDGKDITKPTGTYTLIFAILGGIVAVAVVLALVVKVFR